MRANGSLNRSLLQGEQLPQCSSSAVRRFVNAQFFALILQLRVVMLMTLVASMRLAL
jgi:hypothetical protein